MRSVQTILQELPTSPDAGLSPEGVVQSRQRFGANRLMPLPKESLWKKFLGKFDEPIIKILLAAALLSMVVDLFRPPMEAARYIPGVIVLGLLLGAVIAAYVLKRKEWIPSLLFGSALLVWPLGLATGHASVDGLAVMIAVILATGVAFLSEYKSDREFEVLNTHKDALNAKVLRGGLFLTVPLEEIVVGDVVLLEIGDEIPADGRVLKATDFSVDQSLMTGEAEPVRKQVCPVEDTAEGPDQQGCLYRGVHVVEGLGQMLVAEVGDATYLGRIARELSGDGSDAETLEHAGKRIQKRLTISKELTPLQLKLEHLAGLISKIGYIAAGAIFLALLTRGVVTGEVGAHAGFMDSGAALLRYFMYMVIVIVVAVPEGLPMSVTVSLALAMRKMTRANSLVRQLVACETVGSTTVICTDKTGTLTQNKMTVVQLSWGDAVYKRNTPEWKRPEIHASWPPNCKPLDWIALIAAVNSTANLEKKNDKLVPIGNSTEGALLLWMHEAGIEYQKVRLQYPLLYQIHFSSERKRMTTIVRLNGRLIALVKGAPEWLVAKSAHRLAADGSVCEWTPEARSELQGRLRDAAAQAMRTLAFGYAWLPPDAPDDDDGLHALRHEMENDLVYVGFAAIQDPLRDDVKHAIAECRRAGVQVKMITGDSVETARAIGNDIQLLDRPDALILTSQEFNALGDEEAKKELPRLRILARAQPLDKLRMVKLLQELQEVVAVTGDGANDAPALKKADVGLAMGRAGVEVAKEASKIVLLDDAFSTIVKAIHWGRALYENIQRFVQFQLTINVSALAIAFLGPFFNVEPPFTILQLLWINVIMDTFASIALCSEPPRSGLMKLPPKRRNEPIVTHGMLWNIATTGSFFVVVMMTLLLLLKGNLEHPGLFAGTGEWMPDKHGGLSPFTYRQVSIFFTVYVFFQVWNEINCRSLVPEVSGLHGLKRNPVFLAIIGLIVALQVVIVTLGGTVFQVEPLSILDWLAIAIGTASVLGFAEAMRRVRLMMNRSIGEVAPVQPFHRME